MRVKSFLNLKGLAIALYIIAFYSDFFYAVEQHVEFQETKFIEGKDALLNGWIISRKTMVPWFSNLIFLFLIFFNRPIPILKTILAFIMIWLGLHIFKLDSYTESAWMDTFYFRLYPENGIYIWLTSYFMLTVHVLITEVKIFCTLRK